MTNKEKELRRASVKEDILCSLPKIVWTLFLHAKVNPNDAEQAEKDTVAHMAIQKDAMVTK